MKSIDSQFAELVSTNYLIEMEVFGSKPRPMSIVFMFFILTTLSPTLTFADVEIQSRFLKCTLHCAWICAGTARPPLCVPGCMESCLKGTHHTALHHCEIGCMITSCANISKDSSKYFSSVDIIKLKYVL